MAHLNGLGYRGPGHIVVDTCGRGTVASPFTHCVGNHERERRDVKRYGECWMMQPMF